MSARDYTVTRWKLTKASYRTGHCVIGRYSTFDAAAQAACEHTPHFPGKYLAVVSFEPADIARWERGQYRGELYTVHKSRKRSAVFAEAVSRISDASIGLKNPRLYRHAHAKDIERLELLHEAIGKVLAGYRVQFQPQGDVQPLAAEERQNEA